MKKMSNQKGKVELAMLKEKPLLANVELTKWMDDHRDMFLDRTAVIKLP